MINYSNVALCQKMGECLLRDTSSAAPCSLPRPHFKPYPHVTVSPWPWTPWVLLMAWRSLNFVATFL